MPSSTTTKEDPLYYTGIDLHRDTCTCCTLDQAGTKVKGATLPTNPEVITAYFTALPGAHQAVVECTTGWYWLSDLCQALGIDLLLTHAKYLKAIAYAKVKTDTVDATTMAHVLRLGFIPEAHQISRERRGGLRHRRDAEHISGILRATRRPAGAKATGSKPAKGSGRQERPGDMIGGQR